MSRRTVMSTDVQTLGASRPHLFVTRAATLQYRELRAQPFEEARQELTRLLLGAVPVAGDPRRWIAPLGTGIGKRSGAALIAYVVERDGLLLVASVSLAKDAPCAYSVPNCTCHIGVGDCSVPDHARQNGP